MHSMYNNVITTCVLGTDLLGVLRKCWDRVSLCNLDLVRTFLKTQIGFKFSSLLPQPPECWGYRPAHPRPRVSQIVGISERLEEEMLATAAGGRVLEGHFGTQVPFPALLSPPRPGQLCFSTGLPPCRLLYYRPPKKGVTD